MGKLGVAAYINLDGTQICLRNMLCKPEDGKFVLSSEATIAHLPAASEGRQIVHLSWNPTGTELAVVDSLGGVTLYIIWITVNRLQTARALPREEQVDDCSAILSTFWTAVERQVSLWWNSAAIHHL
jgi:mediator of RNA polymerase II transcription subunit 16, fungi type